MERPLKQFEEDRRAAAKIAAGCYWLRRQPHRESAVSASAPSILSTISARSKISARL